ncbi:unnamed protein product [Pleuronectes platessa]|uniref:Uncharacterized protein n=1 Tax=Pleuronectes platessa TaxID=8262 RepID=A0A9N7U0M9_PLEPL|nr:unnamed protein product [Pleuronectes platessa]
MADVRAAAFATNMAVWKLLFSRVPGRRTGRESGQGKSRGSGPTTLQQAARVPLSKAPYSPNICSPSACTRLLTALCVLHQMDDSLTSLAETFLSDWRDRLTVQRPGAEREQRGGDRGDGKVRQET